MEYYLFGTLSRLKSKILSRLHYRTQALVGERSPKCYRGESAQKLKLTLRDRARVGGSSLWLILGWILTLIII